VHEARRARRFHHVHDGLVRRLRVGVDDDDRVLRVAGGTLQQVGELRAALQVFVLRATQECGMSENRVGRSVACRGVGAWHVRRTGLAWSECSGVACQKNRIGME